MGNYASQSENFPLKIRNVKKYGWKPDIPDQRDIYASFPPNKFKTLEKIDFRNSNLLPGIYNQGNLGSCVSNALIAAFQYDQKKQKMEDFLPSRQFVYYNQRVIEGTVNYDSGSTIRDGIKVLNRLGVCPENDYPYNVEFFTDRPNEKSYKDAQNHKAIQYRKIRPTIKDIMLSLSAGIPVIFGFTVYESFEKPDVARTGIMQTPKNYEKILGGHCVLAVGYDSSRQYLLVRNSWGEEWGQKGYFWMPFSFINARNCGDFWIIQKVKDINKEKQQIQQIQQKEKPVKKPVKKLVEKIEHVEDEDEDEGEDEDKLNIEKIEKVETYDFKEDSDSEEERNYEIEEDEDFNVE